MFSLSSRVLRAREQARQDLDLDFEAFQNSAQSGTLTEDMLEAACKADAVNRQDKVSHLVA